MTSFRLLLVFLFTAIAYITYVAVANHGPNLFPIFFGDIQEMTWRGQFNVDFMSLLTLAGVWLMWRHEFTPLGIVLGISIFIGGGLLLTAYLFIASILAKGDVKVLLLGSRRASSN